MASSLVPGCHVMSDLLTIREKGVLFTLLEPHCKLIKTTVAQVLVAKETQGEGQGWSCLGCGAVCLIEDESLHSYFLRLYCVKRAKLLWEQELYIPFKYTATRTFFHTFPADDHQVGLNFANESEAEEFHLSVKAVQRSQEDLRLATETLNSAGNCLESFAHQTPFSRTSSSSRRSRPLLGINRNEEKMAKMTAITKTEKEDSSTSDPPDSGIKPLERFNREEQFPSDAPPTEVTPTTSSFKDLDPSMRRLLMQAKLTEEDLKHKDIAEAVDCIINRFGGVKAVQRELRNRGPISQTLPRTAGASISLALKKGPLPPVPSIKGRTTSQQTPQGTDTLLPPQIPPPPLNPAPAVPERIRKSASFKHVGFPTAAEKSDQILAALREVFREKQLLQRGTSVDESQQKLDTDKHL